MRLERWTSPEHWETLRAERVGGSEVAALGTETPIETYLERASGSDIKRTMPIVLGTHLEAGVLKAGEELWGIKPDPAYAQTMMVDDSDPRMGYTPDGVGDDYLIEVKCGRKKGWGRGGSRIIPYPYYLQVQWGMEIADIETTWVLHLHGAASGGGLNLSRHPIRRERVLGQALREAAPLLWRAKQEGSPEIVKRVLTMMGDDLY